MTFRKRSTVLAILALTLSVHVHAQMGGKGGVCLVANFKALALKTHNPEERTRLAEAWLHRYAPTCTNEQLSVIKANSPSWLGTGLTQELSSLMEGAVEAKIAGNPALMSQLYESSGKEGTSSTETLKSPLPRAPVVQPFNNNGVLSGSANYGNLSGPTTINQNNLQAIQQNAGASSSQTALPVINPAAPGLGSGSSGRR